jgi:hypothetical protein
MIELIIGGILVLLAIVIVLWFVSIYNKYYRLKNASEATLGQIKVAMKKRLDMIDQLLGSVRAMQNLRRARLNRSQRCVHLLDLPGQGISMPSKPSRGVCLAASLR